MTTSTLPPRRVLLNGITLVRNDRYRRYEPEGIPELALGGKRHLLDYDGGRWVPAAEGGASPAALAPPSSRTPQGQNQRAQVPFIRATKKHREPFFDNTTALTTSAQVITPQNVPAYGFLRGIWIRVDATGGSGTTTPAVASGDAPFNIFSFLGLFDVNGAPLYGPFLTGYNAFTIGKYGGYKRYWDARTNDFQAVQTSGNFRFWLYIPVELNQRNALGSLANLNAAATYKLQMSLAPSTVVFSTPPAPTLPNIRIRCWIDAWAQPPANDLLGNLTDQTPMAHGTTQFWSEQVYTVASGLQTVRLLRVGLYLRSLIFTLRTAAGGTPRTDADWPDPAQLFLDGFELVNMSQNMLWAEQYGLYNVTPNGSIDASNTRDTGVYVFQFIDDDTYIPGNEQRNRYLPTLQSSRLELRGSFGGAAATLSVMTNDVSPNGNIFVPSAATVI